MATKSSTALRRIAGVAFTLLLFCLCLCVAAQAQGTSPQVTASVTTGMSHPAGWGTILQTAIDNQGNWLVVDYSKGGLYELPANGGPAIILVPTPALGGYQNPGIAIDSNNTMYLGGNWSNCLLRIPYDPATETWPGLATFSSSNPTSNCPAPYNFAQYGYIPWNWGFQPWGLAVDKDNNLWVANQVSGNWPFFMPINGAGASVTPGTPVQLVKALGQRASSGAVDPWGNYYFAEELDNKPKHGGVLMVPAGQSGIADETTLTRVDPNLANTVGVVADPAGNLYVSDQKLGTYLVPNVAGTPDPTAAILITNAAGKGAGAVDWSRHIFYAPTSTTQSNGQADVAKINFGGADFGSSAVGKAISSPISVTYTFNGAITTDNTTGSVTPANFAIVEDGVATPDFSITGGTCATGTAYAPGETCSEIISLTPASIGSISAKLLMLDADNNILATSVLHGTGLGATLQATPAMESSIGGKLSTPSQMTTDMLGNIYVADPGLQQVLMYAAGGAAAPVSLGTGLVSPSGVAVDGIGDVFIADSGNGSVVEVPYGLKGLDAASQITLASNLGANLRVAADGLGNLYVADPANARVVKLGDLGAAGPGILGQTEIFLTAGFTTPTNVAVDSNNNLYVIDGSNLFEVANGVGTPATLLNTLSGAAGLAVDNSGAVYIASTGGTVRIPVASGALSTATQTTIASSVTNPTAVAIDKTGNVYLTDGTAENLHVVGVNASLDFGTLATTSASASLPVTLVNAGNAPLTITDFTSTNAVDYSAADVSCISGSPVAAGGSCQVSVTLNPGPGEQGTLTGQIGFKSNAGNGVVVNTTGVGAALGASISKISVGTPAEVVNTPVTITVAAGTGAGMPTGQVIVTFTTVTGSTATASAPLVDGTATFTLAPAAAGNQKFLVAYSGDRTYGRSNANTTAPISKSASVVTLPTITPPFLPYVLSTVHVDIYGGSTTYWNYKLIVNVTAAAGQPTGTVVFNDNSSSLNYQGQACAQASAASGSQAVNNSGQAIFDTGCLDMPLQPGSSSVYAMSGTHIITPVYSGDANYLGFTGDPTTFIAVKSPAVQITPSVPSLTLSSGSTGSINVTLDSMLGYGFAGKGALLNNYDFPVALSCNNLPPHSACTFSYPNPAPAIWGVPNSVYMPCIGTTAAADNCAPGYATVTINTNVPVGTTTSQLASPASFAYAAMFGFGMLGLFFRRRVGQTGRMLLMVYLAIVGGALATSLTACSTTNLSPASQLTTPKGTYAVSIVAQQVGQQCITSVLGQSNCTTASGQQGRAVYGNNNQISLPLTINVTIQ
jgi:hypothetical protein